MRKHILLVLPHPDDEAFGFAGTMAFHLQRGDNVTYACLTLGEMGRNMGFPPFANRLTLPAIRREELLASCRAIGIDDLRMLGFHDKMIEFEDHALLDGKISALLEELRPAVVYTFYPGYSIHPDHDACGAAVIRSVAKLPKAQRPHVRCLAIAGDSEAVLGEPDIVRDVTEFLPQKKASIQAHRTQFQAAELLGSKQWSDEELRARFGIEHFWTYPFAD